MFDRFCGHLTFSLRAGYTELYSVNLFNEKNKSH